jgi:hypothetical protein
MALIALAGCNALNGNRFRYRMTVEVETPQGLRSGSSVVQVTTREGTGIPDTRLSVRIRGQAVAIDMPGGKPLFALIRTEQSLQGAAGFAFAALMPVMEVKGGDGKAFFANLRLLSRKKQIGELPRANYPMMVTFANINDPKTVEKVDPDNLRAQFGEGTRIRRITIQITDDKIDNGIERRFPWWNLYLDKRFDGSSSSYRDLRKYSLISRMSSRAFSTESDR